MIIKSISTLFLLQALSSVSASKLNLKNCGKFTLRAEPKVIGGVDAHIEEFPWQVSLQRLTLGSLIPLPEWKHLCGASIVNKYWLLTAAHCVEGLLNAIFPFQLRAVIGTELWRNPGLQSRAQIISVAEIIVHENWNRIDGFNDIALLRLTNAIEFGDKVNSICLPIDGLNTTGTVTLSGWGLTSDRFSLLRGLPNRLQKIQIPIVDRKDCAKIYNRESYEITDSMVCAGSVRDGRCQGAHTGDSGGALIKYDNDRAYHVGIVSFSLPCRLSQAPDVYTRTDRYVKWIEKNVKP